MVTTNYPNRGDVVWLDFTPHSGHEQRGRRPAVCLSPSAYNSVVGLALFCPITSQVKGYPYEVPLPQDFPIAGVILADQVKSLDWEARNIEYIQSLSDHLVMVTLSKLRTLM